MNNRWFYLKYKGEYINLDHVKSVSLEKDAVTYWFGGDDFLTENCSDHEEAVNRFNEFTDFVEALSRSRRKGG